MRGLEVLILEDRQLLTVSSITATVTPKILPNTGAMIPVVVSGTVEQVIQSPVPGNPATRPPAAQLAPIDALNASRAAPSGVVAVVTDQYRKDEPRVRAPLGPVKKSRTFFTAPSIFNPVASEGLIRDYPFTMTIDLQAKNWTISRQYAITIIANDSEGGSFLNIAALVPHLVGRARAASVHTSSHARPA